MTPTQKDLIDTDGENRAVRAFLLGREVGCKDYEQMRRHMTNSGFNNCWPSEFAGLGGHMSKGDQQMWLRHLFALERLGALAEQPAEQEPTVPATAFDRLASLNESNAARIIALEDQIEGLKQIKAEPQEPVAHAILHQHVLSRQWEIKWVKHPVAGPLFTAPQPAKRVPLTDTEIFDLWGNPKNQLSQWKFARAVIAAYDAKNGITGETE